MTKPSFFIVGAPKCGTTSLYEYLRQHPQIFMPETKEPGYFAKDMKYYGQIKSFKEYLSLFQDSKKQISGEASTIYFYSTSAPKEIKKFNKNAKIIIMIRGPVSAISSMHNHYLTYSLEKIRNIDKWFDERIINKNLPNPEWLEFWKIYQYGDNIERYVKTFGKKNVLILLYDDFKSNPEEEFKKVLNFLNVDNNFIPKFETHNIAKQPRLVFLKNIWFYARKWPKPIVKTIKFLIPVRLRLFIWNFNLTNKNKDKVSEVTRNKIIDYYKPQVLKASKITKRDLSAWLK